MVVSLKKVFIILYQPLGYQVAHSDSEKKGASTFAMEIEPEVRSSLSKAGLEWTVIRMT
jgi:hypothetical protein